MTSVLESITTFVKGYSELEADAPVWVNYLAEKPVQYSIVPLPGSRIVEEYLNGSTSREFPFAFQSMDTTLDDLARLNTQTFFEAFAEWLRTMSNQGTFPEMDTGQKPFKIQALGWGVMFERGEDETGIYQIQCSLEYEQTT